MPEDDSYAETPVSLSEIKAAREDNPKLWTPREMLLAVLRKIDSGEIDPDHVMVLFGMERQDSSVSGFMQAGQFNPFAQIGMLQHSIEYLIRK